MSSPFTVFRRYDRVLMVVLTGLAILTFVLGGAINDPRELNTKMIVIFLAATLGAVAWLSGLSKGKGTEWGLSGALLGAAVGLVITFFSRESSAVYMESGSITGTQLAQFRRERHLANQFLQQAYFQSGGNQFQGIYMKFPQYLFNFGSQGDDVTQEDAVLGEVFRREADQMGIVVSDKAVFDYIKEFTDNKLTAEQFAKIRQQMQLSEGELLKILRDQLKARRAAELLYGQNYLPPEVFWEFYKQLNVKQSADIAVIPVKEFIDETAVPSEVELQALFEQYRNNPPGMSPDGRPVEGAPGFFQPRRVQVGYFEAVPDDLMSHVGDVTEEEIQKLYEERYQRTMPAQQEGAAAPADGPELPAAPTTETPPAAPTTETPPAAPMTETPPAAPAEPAAPAAEPATPEAPAVGEPMSALPAFDRLVPVAFQDAPAEQPATPAPTGDQPAEEPKPETPAPTGDAPAETKPATETPATPDVPAPSVETPPAPEAPPAAPTTEVPPLNDALKAELREEILRRRANNEAAKRIVDASAFMTKIADLVHLPESDAKRLTPEAARKQLEEYAKEHQLTYEVTPPLSYENLRMSEDYPIGKAFVLEGTPQSVSDILFQSAPNDLLHPYEASSFNPESKFAFWKTLDRAPYAPTSLDDGQVRDEVVKAWRTLQAEPKARARADALAKQIRESDKPFAEALANVTTTDKEGDLFVRVLDVPPFTWMQPAAVPQTSFGQAPQVRESVIPGVTDAGGRFFDTVFNKLNVGEVGVAPNRDNTVFYVVKIKDRQPGDPEQIKASEEAFLKAGMQPIYQGLAERTLRGVAQSLGQEMFNLHKVQFFNDQPE